MAARHLVVHGRVQGVFFRVRMREQAAGHRVVGWVANRADGTVEAWLEGAPADVAAVETWIRDGGPADAFVDRVEAAAVAPAGHRAFEIRG